VLTLDGIPLLLRWWLLLLPDPPPPPPPPSVFASLPHQHLSVEPLRSLPFPFTIAVAAAACVSYLMNAKFFPSKILGEPTILPYGSKCSTNTDSAIPSGRFVTYTVQFDSAVSLYTSS